MTTHLIARERLRAGAGFRDVDLLDHAGNRRRLSDLVAGDLVVLHFLRGWWCPEEQWFFRRLLELQDDVEVAYSRTISVSVNPPEVNAAFRAGAGAPWTFLSDAGRAVQERLGLRETTDTVMSRTCPRGSRCSRI